jgi:hypothetical protein
MKNLFIPTEENGYKPYLLRKVALVGYSVFLILFNSFGGILGIDQVVASSITAENIVKLANQERASAGLNTLNTDSRLSAAALAKANNMFEEQYWDHFGPNGETPWQFIRAAGYNYVYAGENLAKGFQTAEGVHEAWMASPTHAANIMSVNYKDIGVAVVQGTLLGKQTTLVVEMFGNLTTDIVTPSDSNQVESSQDTVTGDEEGEIKSIMITAPASSSILNDANVDIKGEVKNISGQYTVEMYDNSKSVGQITSDVSNWEFDKGSDWTEGDHKLQAEITDSQIFSNTVDFTIDSTAPKIDKTSINVKKVDDNYVLSFKIDDTWTQLQIVNDNTIIPVSSENKTDIEVSIPVKEIGNKVVIVASDAVSNVSELDISEYFEKENNVGNTGLVLSLKSSSVGDAVSIAIVSLVFILLCIEIFVYWKKGKLREATGDLFTVGAWWLILSIAIFNGFTGLIS